MGHILLNGLLITSILNHFKSHRYDALDDFIQINLGLFTRRVQEGVRGPCLPVRAFSDEPVSAVKSLDPENHASHGGFLFTHSSILCAMSGRYATTTGHHSDERTFWSVPIWNHPILSVSSSHAESFLPRHSPKVVDVLAPFIAAIASIRRDC